jgi:prepilin-type N-terminal cleavage/methylation domain-containing protein
MRHKPAIRTGGFTLVEMLIAMALGLVLIAAAVELFSKALDATFLVSQRAEMQQNGRAAVGLIAKDISLGGAGLPTGGVQLPTGTGNNPIYGCDQLLCYVAGLTPAGIAYFSNHLYGVIPGPGQGIPITSGGRNTDVVTVVYTDNTFPLNLYTVQSFGPNGTFITMAPPNPQPNPPVPPLNDPAAGIKVGDLILLQNTGAAIGEVTGLLGNTINFADLDPLHINQSMAPSGNIKAISNPPPGTTTIATRILVITYYLDVPPGPDGVRYTADDLPPRLMRQVNGQAPAPVADNIADLQFSYDIFDEATNTDTSNLWDAGMSQGKSPNQIRKVNIVSMTARSALHGTKGFQGVDLATSVGVRNMSFRDRYQ